MSTTELALPTTGDAATWTAQEKALVEAAGLTRQQGQQQLLADRPTVEAFLAHCRRTGLDPIARQIYAIYRGGKWGIQISIDGARLVAERSGEYEGQTPVEWTTDGATWSQVWLSKDAPRAARVGIYRRGFREPLWAVATWDSYAVTDRDGVPTQMWKKFGPLMLGKCAEMLGLRKAFPQDLSGLYSAEEMSQAGGESPAPPAAASLPAVAAAQESDRDWRAEINAVKDLAALTVLANEAQQVGEWGVLIVAPAGETDSDGPTKETVGVAMHRRRAELEAKDVPLPGTEPGKPKARDWASEAAGLAWSEDAVALLNEAVALKAPKKVLDDLTEKAGRLPARPVAGAEESWAAVSEDTEPPAEADAEVPE